MELEVGTRKIERSTATYNQVYSYLNKHVSSRDIILCHNNGYDA